jgi:hypothetical protein
MSNIFEGLVQFGERAEIRPAVAERWDISPTDACTPFICASRRAFIMDAECALMM